MDRPNHIPADTQTAGMFDRPVSANIRRTSQRPDEPRFDAVSFRQSSGLANPVAPASLPPNVAAPRGGVAAPHSNGTGSFRTYVAACAGLGLISAAYLGALAWQRAASLEGALAPVTESLERLATDIAELKQTTAAIDARGRTTADRVAATESRLESFSQVASALPQAATAQPHVQGQSQRPTNRAVLEAAPAPVAAATPNTAPRMAGIELVQPPAPPTRQLATVVTPAAPMVATPAKAVVRAAPPAASAANGTVTVTANPIQTGTLPVVAPARPAGLLVASGPSLDSIRLSWNVLSQNHGAVFGALEPRILPAGDGSAFQLIAGPFASDAEAQKACSTLKARGVGCKPAEYAGAPL